MAVGAILPPLFFERRALRVLLRGWHFQEHPGIKPASAAIGRRQSARHPCAGRC